ncbi:hypothetical protein EFE42_09825 [Methanohalophilus sp. RSK]|uniref:RAMP superfamily CRISPR-associated protein n=1 Tax=Methanohalophilus sp. RSK TaxID=2485783 RepID=UPI000F439250|nr:RAMP superfamily CRISPR-associated protein [Methanohalophilus sp. RSK]RNI11914.1 hypothetical protein EFE42_09825 [Methanohalophilus sp. RSK]
MKVLTATLKNLAPLHIGTGKKTGNFSKTLEYIPGRTIRGMVGYYLYNNNKSLFDALRINEDGDMSQTGVFFKNALPVNEGKSTRACPVSFKWCKKCGHMIDPDKIECTNTVEGRPCLHEGKKHGGFITADSFEKGELESVSVNTQISTKCPITRDGNTSPGPHYEIAPYNIESIVEGTEFEFQCIVEDEYVDGLKEALNNSGIFGGLGGFRTRGYGTVTFSNFNATPASDMIQEKASNILQFKNAMMVTNSPMILRDGETSIIGFDENFEQYVSKSCDICATQGNFKIVSGDKGSQKLNEGIARGWSIKEGNKVSEIIPCIGMGSCAVVEGDPEVMATLEVYGIGEMINSGYGDVYFMEGHL